MNFVSGCLKSSVLMSLCMCVQGGTCQSVDVSSLPSAPARVATPMVAAQVVRARTTSTVRAPSGAAQLGAAGPHPRAAVHTQTMTLHSGTSSGGAQKSQAASTQSVQEKRKSSSASSVRGRLQSLHLASAAYQAPTRSTSPVQRSPSSKSKSQGGLSLFSGAANPEVLEAIRVEQENERATVTCLVALSTGVGMPDQPTGQHEESMQNKE